LGLRNFCLVDYNAQGSVKSLSHVLQYRVCLRLLEVKGADELIRWWANLGADAAPIWVSRRVRGARAEIQPSTQGFGFVLGYEPFSMLSGWNTNILLLAADGE